MLRSEPAARSGTAAMGLRQTPYFVTSLLISLCRTAGPAVQSIEKLAEREGFEPPIPVKVYTLSRRAPSATRPSLRTRWVVHHDFIREAVASNFPC
jgi:hypothetical protein